MATQGLLSIIRYGEVVAKIITGCDGKNIPALAESLRKNPTTDLYALLKRAREHDLGGDSLIVQVSPYVWISDGEVEEELSSLYKDKFYEPRFNPRWANGTADYTEVVELSATKAKSLQANPGDDVSQRSQMSVVSGLPGRCATCHYWRLAPTIVPGCAPEKICGGSLNMTFGMYGQDGRAVITVGDFGCVHYRSVG